MASELIGIDLEGLAPLVKKLQDMPQEVKDAASNDVAKYLFNVVQEQPTPKHITRKQAYGVTFFSDKQRRWFFAALNSGAISVPYKRTQAFRKNWQIIGHGNDTIIVNDAPYGPYLMGEDRQSRMSALIGWKKLSAILQERAARIEAIAGAALKKVVG